MKVNCKGWVVVKLEVYVTVCGFSVVVWKEGVSVVVEVGVEVIVVVSE